jgi:thiol-disulfide isomerase/thioredoxin
MFNFRFYSLFVASCFLFTIKSLAQKELRIGDTCPDVGLKLVNYFVTTAKLSDFKGKVVILDFWGTWCAPCVASFTKLDSIQGIFKDKVQVISVTDERNAIVQEFFRKYSKVKKVKPVSVVEDTVLSKLFPHTTVPHYVWLDQKGKVCAITYSEDVNVKNIQNFIDNANFDFAVKKEPKPIQVSPLQKIAEDSTIKRFEALSAYIPGMYSGVGSTDNMIVAGNSSILNLYRLAYSEGTMKFIGGWNKVKLITDDSLRFTHGLGKTQQFKSMWTTENTYNYVLKVPIGDSLKKWEIMRKNLSDYFPFISAKVQLVARECYVLKQINNNARFQAKEAKQFNYSKSPYNIRVENGNMKLFVELLKWAYQNSELQVLDETGYTGNVDIQIEAEVSKPEELNKALLEYGLILRKEIRNIEILVIRDLQSSKVARINF